MLLRNRTCSISVVIISLLACAAIQPAVSAPSPEPRLERTNLLIYRASSGAILPVKSIPDWQKRRGAVLAGMQKVMGPLPGQEKRCPLDVRIDEEVDCGSYVRCFLSYAAEPESRVPAYLLVPKKVLAQHTTARARCLELLSRG